jgi:anti-sigma factor RsiW
MRCSKLISELSNYLDNDIDAGLRAELEQHRDRCPECRVIIDTTRKTIEIYRGCEPYPLPAGLHERLLNALRKHQSAENSPT